MKISKTVLNRLEGEVELKLEFDKSNKIKNAHIFGVSYRDFSNILKNKPYLDSLALTSRVCGICGHAHLTACVRAIEDAYIKNGVKVHLTSKAQKLRMITLLCEILQNHIRWFYAYFMSEIPKSYETFTDYIPFEGRKWKSGLSLSNYPIKIIAVFGGQWPHNSYAMPGGITSDFSYYELSIAKNLISEFIKGIEEQILGIALDKYLSYSYEELLNHNKRHLGDFIKISLKQDFINKGISFDSFIVGGEIDYYVEPYILNKESVKAFDINKIKMKEHEFKNVKEITGVIYEGKHLVTGPVSRGLLSSGGLLKTIYKKHKNSIFLRVLARLDEIINLSYIVKNLLDEVDPKEPSFISPQIDSKSFSGEGIGIVEASRGTLIHKISIENGLMREYKIITPTLWNLGYYEDIHQNPAQKAIIGLDSETEAYICLRSFDVCASCISY